MSTQKCCDLCGEIVIHKLYFITLTQELSPKKLVKLAQFSIKPEVYKALTCERNKYKEETQVFELCDGCKKVLDYLFVMRVANLNQLKNEIQGIINLPLNTKHTKELE